MNTKWTKLFSTLLLASMIFLVVGCSDDDKIVNDITDPDTIELFGTWAQSAVTIDGVEANLAEFFEWGPDAVGIHITLNENFTYDVNEFDASNTTLYYESGTITVTGSNIVITVTSENGTDVTPTVVADGTWVISGNTLTISLTKEEAAIVITFTKVV